VFRITPVMAAGWRSRDGRFGGYRKSLLLDGKTVIVPVFPLFVALSEPSRPENRHKDRESDCRASLGMLGWLGECINAGLD